MVSARASSLGGHWAGLTPRAAQGRSKAVVSALASSLGGHWAGLTPRAAQGRSRAVVSAPASSLGGHRAGLTQRSGRGWPWPREDRGHRPAFPGWSRAHPQRSTVSPCRGQDTHIQTRSKQRRPCAGTGHRAQGTGHRAGRPWTAGGDAGRQAATLDGPGGRHKHQYFSAHAHGGLAQWPHYN